MVLARRVVFGRLAVETTAFVLRSGVRYCASPAITRRNGIGALAAGINIATIWFSMPLNCWHRERSWIPLKWPATRDLSAESCRQVFCSQPAVPSLRLCLGWRACRPGPCTNTHDRSTKEIRTLSSLCATLVVYPRRYRTDRNGKKNLSQRLQ